MADDREAETLFQRQDLVRLEATVRRVMTSFVSVALPDPWAPASFALEPGLVAAGDVIGVAGSEDPKLASEKKKGLRVLAVRVGPAASPRFLLIHHADAPGGGGAGASGAPPKDDMDWSDV